MAGDSAGGNLAAAVTLRARAAGPALAAQVLVYPVTDAGQDTASSRDFATGFLLTAEDMAFFWESYLGPDGDPLRRVRRAVAGGRPEWPPAPRWC